jgi:hypothetical protein
LPFGLLVRSEFSPNCPASASTGSHRILDTGNTRVLNAHSGALLLQIWPFERKLTQAQLNFMKFGRLHFLVAQVPPESNVRRRDLIRPSLRIIYQKKSLSYRAKTYRRVPLIQSPSLPHSLEVLISKPIPKPIKFPTSDFRVILGNTYRFSVCNSESEYSLPIRLRLALSSYSGS